MTRIPSSADHGGADLTPGQLSALRSAVRAKGARLCWLVSKLVGREVRAEEELRRSDWQEVRDGCFPDWKDGDWETRDAGFEAVLEDYAHQYSEEVEGQERLFPRDGARGYGDLDDIPW